MINYQAIELWHIIIIITPARTLSFIWKAFLCVQLVSLLGTGEASAWASLYLLEWSF